MRLSLPHLLRVCQSCRVAGTARDGTQPGLALVRRVLPLFEAWSERSQVVLLPTNCLGQCDAPCAAALSGPGKSSPVFVGLGYDDASAAALLEYTKAYVASPDGRVPSERCPALLQGKALTLSRRMG